ncbi:MAG TPA: CehA/McbA family metallohydrolase [Streptosporangiaceae bacterium]|nr:CehA/McbA family metallohydrolase [Streptosporangiaceae bacterium]
MRGPVRSAAATPVMNELFRRPSGAGGLAGPTWIWSDGYMVYITRHTGRWTVEDQFASPWHYLPVEVPPGSYALRAELDYERPAGVLDLGCLGPRGFRGWSGSARDSYVIAADEATPGYLPGEIEAGLWHVIIGVHRIPPEGLRYRVTAEITQLPRRQLKPLPEPPPPPERASRRRLPASDGRRWLAGDLHTHTLHSDGALTVCELARLAVERGMDFIAVTDHNTVSHHRELAAAGSRYGITLLPGQEVTTSYGHAGALGDIGWVDFRQRPDGWLEATRQRGGLLSVNHPIAGPVSWMHAMQGRPPLVEVWHWSWLDLSWTTPLSWWLAWDAGAVPVGGSDWHRAGSDAPPGSPTTWVECASDDPAGILAGLSSGRVAISAGRDGPVLLRADGELVAVDADGAILAGPNGPCARVRGNLARFRGTPGCHRLLSGTGATLALTP